MPNRPFLSGFERRMRAFVAFLVKDYEPAAHYMRGPGPKTREKELRDRQNGGDSPRSIHVGAPTKIASGLPSA